MLDKCFNIFENKGNVVWMLHESLNQLKFDSTHFQQVFNIFYAFNNVERPVQTPQHLVQQRAERMLNQMLKPFKRALSCKAGGVVWVKGKFERRNREGKREEAI